MSVRPNLALSRRPLDMDEFSFIQAYLAPLAGPEGLGLIDDAALLKPPLGKDIVLTKDTMVEGVHFPAGDYGSKTAGKLLRVNLSDLAAKGAEPMGYMLSIAWSREVDEMFYGDFASGLREVQDAYEFKLLGGDTVSTDGPMVVTATLIGQVPSGTMVTRSGAKAGDDIWVTGTIGDAYLGLQHVLGFAIRPKPSKAAIKHFEAAYYRPEPRLVFHKTLRQYASACTDISDGLIADIGNIAKASGAMMSIDAERIPLSNHAITWLKGQKDSGTAFKSLVTSGDDYELAFTARPDFHEDIEKAGQKLGLHLSMIGRVETAGEGVRVISSGKSMTFDKTGHRHMN